MKHISILVLYASIMSCCHSRYDTVTLIPDNKWHTVYTMQVDASCILEVEKSSAAKDEALNYSSRIRTQVRLLRLKPFQDITHLPDNLPPTTDVNSEAQRSSDFGPQDMSQDGSKRIILFTSGVQLLSRTNQPNAILFIKKINNMESNQEAMNALMAKLYAIVAAKDNITNVPRDTPFVSFCRPGIPLTPESLDFGFVTMNENQNALAADFADIANDIPSLAGFYSPTGRKVYDEYYKAINAPVLPISQLTDAEKAQLEEAKSYLFKDELRQDLGTGRMVRVEVETLIHERYKDFKAKWQNEIDKYYSELENYLLRKDDNPMAVEIWSRKEPILRAKVQDAFEAWEAAGKDIIEEKQALISNFERRGPNKLWADRRERYRSHTRSDQQGGSYQLTKYFPQKFWTEGTWTQFTFSHNEVHKVDTSTKQSYGGGGGAGFGLWSFGASFQREQTDTNNEADISNFELSVDISRIPIRRTWMDASVFTSKSWKFDASISTSEYLSDGKNPPGGAMVCFPVAMIVARNLKVKMNMSNEKNSYSLSKINASLRAGWGPFSIKGNYSRETTRQTHDFVQTASGIEASGMQVIGFVCQVLPKCPDPDLALNWGEQNESGHFVRNNNGWLTRNQVHENALNF